MVPYQHQIPGTNVSFEMIPVPGGVFDRAAAKRTRKQASLPGEGRGRSVLDWQIRSDMG